MMMLCRLASPPEVLSPLARGLRGLSAVFSPLRGRSLLLAALLLSLLTTAASSPLRYKKIRVFVLAPPQLILPNVRTVAVMDFQVRPGNEVDEVGGLGDAVTTALMDEDRGVGEVKSGLFGFKSQDGRTLLDGATTSVYRLIERSQLYSLLGELNLTRTGDVDAAQAAELGRLAGADAILIGNVGSRVVNTVGRTRDGQRFEGSRGYGRCHHASRRSRVRTGPRFEAGGADTQG